MIDDFVPQKPTEEDPPQPSTPAAIDLPAASYGAASTTDQPPDTLGSKEPATTSSPANRDGQNSKRQPIKKLRQKWHALSKPKKIAAVIVIIIIIGAGVTTALALTRPAAKVAVIKLAPAKTAHAAQPATLTSTLTGLPISSASVNQRPVTGVMIENSDDARPQSGLDQAGVVFEAVTEAGITRFLALYQDTQPAYLGPVRSARPYFVQWCMGFDCVLAHVGGSPDALTDIQDWGVRDLNQFYNGSAYERISSRQAPHNVYTSASALNTLEASKGFTSSSFTGWPRKSDSPAKSPTAASININPSSADFASSYTYNASSDDYLRSEAGQPHLEINASGTQTQITPKVVIAIVVPQSQGALDSSDAYYTDFATLGSGQAYVFQDGTVTIGTWQKTSNASQITFTNASGQPVKLNAGQTWVTAVGSASEVSYKP